MSDRKTQERADRLKAALRENLKRRKAQARGRQSTEPAQERNGDGEGPGSSEPQRD